MTRADDISLGSEVKLRSEVIEFMRKFGFLVKLNTLTVSKAIVIFHKFTLQYSLSQFNNLLYGAAAIFLVNKLDDDFKKNFLDNCAKAFLFLQNN